ncbi:pyrroline-5-carboxylate reductase family protein [Mesoplasma tabanidae]|uniref:Pyrroline-5-carboxylate reductase n=1 Tax=Mesoplasma tabanidae TaxID=219745 RepID=A0A2K8P3B4_9MOLU|nr:pyrroline-5-carboxylate reductase dimerization domain-containing protein [Mesoplasma tabanidae]ATZ21251.1 pyrroline-5-carboxylate reductase [Mesoplasma tabanidae]
MKKVLFIGLGHMGSALIKGILKNSNNNVEIFGYDAIKETQQKAIKNMEGLKSLKKLSEIQDKNIDFIVIGTRPIDVEPLCKEIDELDINKKTIICMANAVTIDNIQNCFINNKDVAVIRMMPNMNASIQKSVTALASKNASIEVMKFVTEMFQLCGLVENVSEDKFGTLTAISGCSPSYVISFFKAMTDYAIKSGFEKEQAFRIIEQVIIGSAMNASKSEVPLRTVVDQICVPNGSTIEGQKILDNKNFEQIVQEALLAADKKATN